MTLNINLTRRVRRRKLKDGSVVEQTRYVLNWRDPRTGEREQRFFERQREAQDKRSEIIAAYERGIYSSSSKIVTVAGAVTTWLETKRGAVRPITFATYAFQSRYVVGPLATSDARRAIIQSGNGAKPKDRPIELLGREKVQELTTRRIRAWHKLLSEEVSIYCANKAMQLLKAALALAAEDHEFRPPAMPSGLQRQRDKARKAVLTPEEVAKLLAAARDDVANGLYVAFPFLAGTRPSEQLVGRRRLRGERHPHPANPVTRRFAVRVHEDRGQHAFDPDVAAPARHAACLARSLPAQGRQTRARVPCPWCRACLAVAESWWRRTSYLRQLPQALLVNNAEATGPAGGDAAQRPAQFHLDASGAGCRSWPRRQASRPQERSCDALPLHPRHARRGGCGKGARPRLCGVNAVAGH